MAREDSPDMWEDPWQDPYVYEGSTSQPSAPQQQTSQQTAPVNNNPYFDPGTNIKPGEDIKLSPTITNNYPNKPASTTTGGTGDNWDAARVSAYFASRGVTPNASSPDYWAQKWNEWGKNDPAYFMQRLSQADEFGGGGGQPSGPPSGGSTGTYTPAGSNFSFTYSSPYAAPQGVSAQLYNMLMQRAQQGTQVNADDPNIRQQMDPAMAQIERSRRNYLADTAERRGPLSNIQGESRVTAEKAGQAQSQLQASLIGKEIQSRRDEIQNALTQLGTQLNADQQRALNDELGHLNAALSKYSIESGNDQFAARFGLDSTNQANYWDSVRRGLF